MSDTDQKKDQKKEPRPFGTFLVSHRGGALERDLTEKLAEVVNAVESTGRKGSLTLQVVISPATKNGVGLIVQENIVAKPPKVDPPARVYFPDGNGGLVTSDPNQRTLEEAARDLADDASTTARDVTSGTEKAREV